MSQLGFFPDIIILSFSFFLIYNYRKQIINLFYKTKLPKTLLYAISPIPFIIIEENINSGAIGDKFTLIPWTMPFLLFFILILGIIVKYFKIENMKRSLIGFVTFGILWEILIGGLRGQILVLNPLFYIFMIFWVGLSYAYLIIVPLEILFNKNK